MSDDATLDEFTETTAAQERQQTPIGELPTDWEMEWLKDVVEINPDGFSEDDWALETFEYISLSEASDGEIEDSKTTPIEDAPSRAQRTVQQGDILVGTVRPKQRSHGFVGKKHAEKVCSSGFGVLRSETRLNSRYLLQAILSNRFFSQMEAYVAGSGYPSVKISDLKKHRAAIPPLSEQRKIATVLHTVDQAIQKTGEVIERYNIIKSEISEELVFRGISSEEHKTVRIGPKKAKVASDWSVSTFGDICDVQQGLQIAKSNRFRKDGEHRYQYITVQYLNDPQDPANNWYIESPRDTVVCSTEDVLMTRTGNTGEVVTGVEGVFHNNFFKIEFDSDVLLRDYLVHYLESKAIQDVLISYAGTTTIPDLNHGEFFNIPVLLPPIDQQASISKKVGQLSKAITIEKEYLNYLHSVKQGVMQDLLSGTVRTTDVDIDIPQEVAKYA